MVVVALVGAFLAVLPATARIGALICFLAVVPAIVAFVRARRRNATTLGRARVAVVVAPVFFVVGCIVSAPAVAPQPVVTSTLAAPVADPAAVVPAAVQPAAPTTVAPTTVAPTTTAEPAPTTLAAAAPAPLLKAPAQVQAPVVAPAPAKPAPVKAAPAPVESAPVESAPACDESTHYVNSSGSCVLRPVAGPSAPAGATARCKDGTYSSSAHRQGTCSRHGGVAQWL